MHLAGRFSYLPILKGHPWVPVAVTFHFLCERFSLKGWRDGVPTFPGVCIIHKPVSSGSFSYWNQKPPLIEDARGRSGLTVVRPHELTATETQTAFKSQGVCPLLLTGVLHTYAPSLSLTGFLVLFYFMSLYSSSILSQQTGSSAPSWRWQGMIAPWLSSITEAQKASGELASWLRDSGVRCPSSLSVGSQSNNMAAWAFWWGSWPEQIS